MIDEDKTKEQLLSELQELRGQLTKAETLLSQYEQINESPSGDYTWATSLLATLLDAVIIFDEHQNITFFNQSAEKIFGYRSDEAVGEPLDMLLPERFVEVHRRHVSEFAPAPEATLYMDARNEIRGRRKDGSEFPARASVTKLFRNNKVQFITVLRDISEHKLIEEELMRYRNHMEMLVEARTAELKEEIAERKQAEETLRKLSQALIQSPTSVMITDVEGNIEYVNPAFTKVTGYSPEEVIGHNPRMLNSGVHPPAYYEALWNSILSGKTWQADVCNRRKNGELYWELQSISPIRNLQGEITHFVAVKVDQTERRLAESQRLQLALEKEKVVLLRNFIGDISHDLKTPISIFKTHLYLLEKTNDPAKFMEKLQVLVSTTQHLEKLIEDLITMSRLDGSAELTFSTLNLHSMIYNVDARMRSLARQKNIQIALELDTNVPPIQADASELDRALTNLVDNAVKFTPENGAITIRTRAQDRAVVMEVCDTGPGIHENDLPHIFNRFYRTDKARSRERGGTGLGLAIVKKVIEMHAGHVEAESTLGEGSIFRIYLPAIES